MRKVLVFGALALMAFGLCGCVVASVGGAVVDGAVTATSTVVDVTGDVVSGAADAVTGTSDKQKQHDSD
jgi:hypothetical protein